jgi:cell division cycle 20-like protein 1 (cofactor of APC complex)
MDDFYLNLLDWSSKNLIAVACTSSVILWNNNKTQSETLFTYEPINLNSNGVNNEIYASSLIWSEDGEQLAVGNSCGQVELYDINKKEKICSFKGHSSRVGVVAWNKNLISSGSKDFSIITRDIRCKNDDENIIRKFYGHNQEVCGLKWSFDGSQLASGGNDNNLMIWNLHSNKPLMSNSDHIAAVKAIAWSPHQHNILASGGGTADRTIRFWNTNSFEQISKIDTGSQVCNLVFSKTSNELVSTHGYSLNHINIWKLPNMEKITTLNGHSFRVLYLGLSPDGTSIVTGAGDKRLKFWNVFPPFKKNYNSKLFPSNRDFR